MQDLLEATRVSTAAGPPRAGDTGLAGGHRGEYRLQVYQELEIQDLLETTGVSRGSWSTRRWRYRTCWRPQG